ncbi:DUF1902 domain-containing protein [Leptospirillum ferriphilum]|uniref:DUF1902 domain-containing protein n=1 Tax=Leptospirillum ferriphilum TaxID=178606 RepID=UPI003CC7DB83
MAVWDDEAGVWVASRDGVPGLITEAEMTEALLEQLCDLVPDLLELSGSSHGPVRIFLHSDRIIPLPAGCGTLLRYQAHPA